VTAITILSNGRSYKHRAKRREAEKERTGDEFWAARTQLKAGVVPEDVTGDIEGPPEPNLVRGLRPYAPALGSRGRYPQISRGKGDGTERGRGSTPRGRRRRSRRAGWSSSTRGSAWMCRTRWARSAGWWTCSSRWPARRARTPRRRWRSGSAWRGSGRGRRCGSGWCVTPAYRRPWSRGGEARWAAPGAREVSWTSRSGSPCSAAGRWPTSWSQ